MSFVFGLDSGGTKTLAAIADRSGTVVSLAGCPSLDPSGGQAWVEILGGLLARFDALSDLSAAVFGMPFHGEIEVVSQEQRSVVAGLMPIRPIVENDVRIAFDGAFAGDSGALILSGTGSMAWASLNGPDDPHVRTGGWGDAFGGEGSAFWIGRESLRYVSRELDGRSPRTDFSAAFLSHLGLKPHELIAWCYGLQGRRRAFARLATVTSTLAGAGDPTACAIMRAAAAELADILLAAWRLAAGDRPLRWSFAGGVTNSAVVLRQIEERAACTPVPRRLPPIGGALYRAAVDARWDVTPEWLERLNASIHRFPAFVEQANQEARN